MADAKPIRGVLETSLYVDDLDAAVRFYRDVMGLELIAADTMRDAFFRCGPGVLLLFRADLTLQTDGEIPPHGAAGPGHAAFNVPQSELPAWEARLRQHGVEIERDHEWFDGMRSLYFRDPAGNCLELTSPGLWDLD